MLAVVAGTGAAIDDPGLATLPYVGGWCRQRVAVPPPDTVGVGAVRRGSESTWWVKAVSSTSSTSCRVRSSPVELSLSCMPCPAPSRHVGLPHDEPTPPPPRPDLDRRAVLDGLLPLPVCCRMANWNSTATRIVIVPKHSPMTMYRTNFSLLSNSHSHITSSQYNNAIFTSLLVLCLALRTYNFTIVYSSAARAYDAADQNQSLCVSICVLTRCAVS